MILQFLQKDMPRSEKWQEASWQKTYLVLKMIYIYFTEIRKRMLCEKGGEQSLFPHFQQGELSLLFLIYVCSYMYNSVGKKNHYLVSQLSANKICYVNVYLWVLRPCAMFITLTLINVSYERSSWEIWDRFYSHLPPPCSKRMEFLKRSGIWLM